MKINKNDAYENKRCTTAQCSNGNRIHEETEKKSWGAFDVFVLNGFKSTVCLKENKSCSRQTKGMCFTKEKKIENDNVSIDGCWNVSFLPYKHL